MFNASLAVARKVVGFLTMTDRSQERVNWYTAKMSELRIDAYRAIDADDFVRAEDLFARVNRLEQRRARALAQQAASYDNFRF